MLHHSPEKNLEHDLHGSNMRLTGVVVCLYAALPTVGTTATTIPERYERIIH